MLTDSELSNFTSWTLSEFRFLLQRPLMFGTALFVEGRGLGLLATWEVVSSNDAGSMRWRELWGRAGGSIGGVGAVPGFQSRLGHEGADLEVWSRAAFKTSILAENVLGEAFAYYATKVEVAPTVGRAEAMKVIGRFLNRIVTNEMGLLHGWRPEVIDGFYHASKYAQEWLLVGDSKASVVQAVSRAALALREPRDYSWGAAIACRRLGIELTKDVKGADGKLVTVDAVLAALEQVATGLMGTVYSAE